MIDISEPDSVRQCGNCKLCCKVFIIPDLHKLAVSGANIAPKRG